MAFARPGRAVDGARVPVLDERDRAAVDGLGRDMADAQTGRPAGEATVGQQQHVLADARALDGAGDREHLTHAGSALRPLVADDDRSEERRVGNAYRSRDWSINNRKTQK